LYPKGGQVATATGPTRVGKNILVRPELPSFLILDQNKMRSPAQGVAMLSVLIGVLIICVVGAICFWAIDKFVREARLANLLKLLVVLICLASILQRVLPLAGVSM
jgi:hypothetical protein